MALSTFRQARRTAVSTFALALSTAILAGCSMFGGDSQPEKAVASTATASVSTASVSPAAASTPAATPAAAPGQIDVRQYLGPDYCPELRIITGAELLRQYERGFADDPAHVIWQASVGKTARECLWDLQGGLTLKVGFAGRVIAGPKGGAATVPVPFRIAVVKNKEAVLTTQDYSVDVSIPAEGSTAFTQVKEVLVPSPGQDRDYIIYVGFDVGEWDPLRGTAIAAVEEPPPPPPPEEEVPPAAPPKPKEPNVLPTPTDGFVLQ